MALLLLMVVALSTIQIAELEGDRRVLEASFAAPDRRLDARALAVAERVAAAAAPDPRLYLVGSISWLLLFGFVTWSLLLSVLRQRAVTSETISLAVSIYLLFGLTWGILYVVIFEYQPHAFSFGGSGPFSPSSRRTTTSSSFRSSSTSA